MFNIAKKTHKESERKQKQREYCAVALRWPQLF